MMSQSLKNPNMHDVIKAQNNMHDVTKAQRYKIHAGYESTK